MNIHGKVYLVGGAVRDILLGKPPKDRDYVVVGGSQENLLSLGFKQVGADFPVFLHPHTKEEYALARVERKSGIGYNGFTVETDGVTLMDDLARRDFTINAMAMDGNLLIDPFNGQQDLTDGKIRHVTDAFKDDPLRVLRAARFAARYGFIIVHSTKEEASQIPFVDLNSIPPERILLEVEKAIADQKFPQFVANLRFLGVEWILKKVLYDFKVVSRIPDGGDVQGTLVALCVIALVNNFELSNFPGLAQHRQVANLYHDYYSTKSFTALERMIGALGDFHSEKFQLLLRGVSILTDPGFAFLMLKGAWFVRNSITSKTALEIDQTLSGEQLGKSIRELRVQALENFFKG